MAHVIDFKEAGFDSVLDELEWRGLISQSTDRDRLAEALNGEPITYYCCRLPVTIRSRWSAEPPV